MQEHKVGDIVLFRPRWPNVPAYGIWTSDTVLTSEGRPVRISGERIGGSGSYSVQFDRDNDGTFNDCHWPAEPDEIIGTVENYQPTTNEPSSVS